MTEIRGLYTLWLREVKRYLRDRVRIVSGLITPLLWLIIFGTGIRLAGETGSQNYQQYLFPGIVGQTLLFTSMFTGISVLWDREFGFMKEILVAPVSRFSIVVGKALSGTIVSTIQAVIILALFPFLGFKLGLLQIIAAVLICASLSFCISAFGIVIATFYESYESFSVIMNFIIMPMFFLSGAMYPVKLLPGILQIATKLNPLTYGIDAIKHILLPNRTGYMSPDFSLLTSIIVIILTSAGFVLIAGKSFERKG